MENLESMMRKIQLLINLSENNPNEQEAESAAMKVQELLFKYNLSMAQVNAKLPDEPKENIVKKKVQFVTKRRQWLSYIYQAVEQSCYVRCAVSSDYVIFVGRQVDIDIAAYTFDFLQKALWSLRLTKFKEYSKQYKSSHGYSLNEYYGQGRYQSIRNEWIESWLLGAATSVYWKLYKQAQSQTSQSYGLILFPKDAINKCIQEDYSGQARKTSTTVKNNAAFNQGVEDGRKISVNKALTNINNDGKMIS